MDTKVFESMLSYKRKVNLPPINVVVDELTPCLTHRLSLENYDTHVDLFNESDLQQVCDWQFQWDMFFRNVEFQNAEVFKLLIKGQHRIEGLISLEPDDNFIFVHLVESAPWNVGSDMQEFIGVGAHLFAFACKKVLN